MSETSTSNPETSTSNPEASTSQSPSSSSRFLEIYDTLPADARFHLIEQHLLPLLNTAPPETTSTILASISSYKSRFAGMPDLNYEGKKMEIDGLLQAIDRDAKRSLLKGRSERAELLQGTMESIGRWMGDIWRVVFEYETDFTYGHECLLMAGRTLEALSMTRGGCKCSFLNLYLNVIIKQRSAKVVKSFYLTGAAAFDRVLHWVWRDLFLSLLATGTERQKKHIPEMLGEIEKMMGWHGLERLLHGGKRPPGAFGDDDDDDDDDVTECGDDPDQWFDEDEDEDEEREHMRVCSFHEEHWDPKHKAEIPTLREHISNHLLSVFALTPTLDLYLTIQNLAIKPLDTEVQLLKLLNENATTSSDSFAGALEIYAYNQSPNKICELLDSHSHLLRPRDHTSLRKALLSLSRNRHFRARASTLIEKELIDTARHIHAALLPSYSSITDPIRLAELKRVLQLRVGSTTRQDRVLSWLDAVSTPGSQTPNGPMAFAAMMMGLPIAPVSVEDEMEDPMGILDGDVADADLDDLREELKPRLRERWEGWVETAGEVGGSGGVLGRVYEEMVRIMPWLGGQDIVEEMINRLTDRPSKHYLCDALEALSAFVKKQRKKAASQAAKRKKAAAAAFVSTSAFTSASASASTSTSASTSHTPTQTPRSPTPAPPPVVPTFADEDDDDEPPPLEPITGPMGSNSNTDNTSTVIPNTFGGGIPSTFGGIEDVD
ncbi:uncharacterized protein STEHIDRAFT_131963 [Stereum hirsutum FP-91666 SS1]|uniref:uncharacterized protein n=1 Tax=Stereum hirsutum (strain FP-91666) TaxID=721885 RepID=UPI000444A679|nr:uncharacterized protein STEHIDRAFT_131963 [Stereum hirsutum FP-91666 SS1]EIM85332.1 hypothetical protein STEHIDRAFT_131963 [Stereum hirsutum FP-91666 SS1]